MYDFDDIDRALFSLELEEPPETLRASILAVTVHAPSEVTARPFTLADFGITLGLLSVAVWLSLTFVNGHGWGASVGSAIHALGTALVNPTVLAWLGAGASTAVWLSLSTLTRQLAGVRSSTA